MSKFKPPKASATATGEDTAAGAEKAGEKIAGLDVKSAEFKETVGGLNDVLPGLGTALIVAFDPESIPFVALAAGINTLIDLTEQYRKKNEEAATATIAHWEAQRKAMEDTIAANEKYAASFNRKPDESKQLQNAEKADETIQHAKARQHQQILDAQEQAELAGAGGDKVKESEIRAKYANLKTDQSLGDRQHEITHQRSYLKKQEKIRDNAHNEYDAAHQRKVEAINDTTPAEKAAEQLKKLQDPKEGRQALLQRLYALTDTSNEEDARKAVDQAKKSAPDFLDAPEVRFGSGITKPIGDPQRVNRLQDALKDVDESKKAIAENQNIVDAHASKVDAATKAENKAHKAFDDASTAVEKMVAALKTATSVLKIDENTATQTQAIQRDGIITAGVNAKESHDDSKFGLEANQRLNDLFNTSTTAMKGFLDIIKHHQTAHTSVADEIEKLKAYAAQLASQNKNASTTINSGF